VVWRGPGEDAGCVKKMEPERGFSVKREVLGECIKKSGQFLQPEGSVLSEACVWALHVTIPT
jgi:hypothetical protein